MNITKVYRIWDKNLGEFVRSYNGRIVWAHYPYITSASAAKASDVEVIEYDLVEVRRAKPMTVEERKALRDN